MCTVGNVFKFAIFPNIGKTNVLAGDETKHVLLFIFHALYMGLTVEDLHKRRKKKEMRMMMDPI